MSEHSDVPLSKTTEFLRDMPTKGDPKHTIDHQFELKLDLSLVPIAYTVTAKFQNHGQSSEAFREFSLSNHDRHQSENRNTLYFSGLITSSFAWSRTGAPVK